MEPEAKRAKINPTAPPVEAVVDDSSSPSRQVILPVEVLDHIVGYLKADDDLPALAVLARANRQMYDFVIPKLYETVSTKSMDKLGYGHGQQRRASADQGKSARSDIPTQLIGRRTISRPTYPKGPRFDLHSQMDCGRTSDAYEF
jgi:hypothetical protein